MSRATIADVARHAEVSVGTVSRVLNNARCHPTRKKRVEDAMRELKYVPNASARAIRSSRSHIVGILMDEFSVNNTFWIQTVFQSYWQALLNAGFQAVTHVVPTKAGEEECLRCLRQMSRLEGLLAASTLNQTFLRLLEEYHPVPLVVEEFHEASYAHGLAIASDYGFGIRRMVDHLVALGHRTIGVLGNDGYINRKKTNFFLEAVRAYIPDYDEGRVLLYPVAPENRLHHLGARLTSDLLDRFPDTTAIFYVSDSFVLGGVGELGRRRLAIPDDISIAGFDNSLLARNMVPELSSVGFDYELRAARLVQEMLRIIRPEDYGASVLGRPPVLETQYYPRESTARPRTAGA